MTHGHFRGAFDTGSSARWHPIRGTQSRQLRAPRQVTSTSMHSPDEASTPFGSKSKTEYGSARAHVCVASSFASLLCCDGASLALVEREPQEKPTIWGGGGGESPYFSGMQISAEGLATGECHHCLSKYAHYNGLLLRKFKGKRKGTPTQFKSLKKRQAPKH